MARRSLAAVTLLAFALTGCAVSGGVSTASVTAQGDEVTVRSSQWGGTVACGGGLPGDPPCAAFPAGEAVE